MPSRFVIHTVGPVWKNGTNGDAGKLAKCYFNSLSLAADYQLTSIAFPNISTGVYGYPKSQAAAIAIETVKKFLTKETTIKKVLFVCFDDENLELYHHLLKM